MNVGCYCLPRRNIRVSIRGDTQRIGCYIGLSSQLGTTKKRADGRLKMLLSLTWLIY
jgi:hypothetical protein